ncbi:cobyrinic acid ac-diamide synthase [Amycolatopsis alkalitolerans]|uniref:Cobyrinic acid ac-diamide synthase n=1 Tax=Amycolatopsis alkalitolerans TaxID=2547244 RepID=A0A5C4M2W8_9PSEU|nr:cobyrinic acid ac-diamide synthase [Amycolatopsis alkalitolerans]TNC26568.1 cobyrinic acid ac-diamide synthase [Amycolatopsis alkalitolerans]
MSRRASLPGASELFRLTSSPALEPVAPVEVPRPADERGKLERGGATRRGSGRQKHDSKITVYVSGDELVAMEQARLALRAQHGLVIDRGRLVREAVAVLLADFDQHGPDSVLVQRLREHEFDTEEAAGS